MKHQPSFEADLTPEGKQLYDLLQPESTEVNVFASGPERDRIELDIMDGLLDGIGEEPTAERQAMQAKAEAAEMLYMLKHSFDPDLSA